MALLLEISWQGVGTGLGMPRPEEAQMGEKPKSKVPATSHSRPGFAALPAVADSRPPIAAARPPRDRLEPGQDTPLGAWDAASKKQ